MKIEDLGFIGDLHTAALVDHRGTMVWLCLPRFDSPACFASLVGDRDNGFWSLAPSGPVKARRQHYRPDTLVLETEFDTAGGTVRVIDFMHPDGKRRDVLRLVEGVRGRVKMAMRLRVRFNYGEIVPWVRRVPEGLAMIAGSDALLLRSNVPTEGRNLTTCADFELRAGESRFFTLSWYPSHEKPPPALAVRSRLASTEKFWQRWCARCTYRGPWRDPVMRSLITLKALTYRPTGGIMAAATTSLPEKIGGSRNWDYRYCWLRDATFTLFALRHAGYTSEAGAWSGWLLRAIAGDPEQIQMLYGANSGRVPDEVVLAHLGGYAGSRPVRLGNAAARQYQFDIYGELMDVLHVTGQMGLRSSDDLWRVQRHLVEFVARHWREPDQGIWEFRGPRRHFTYSKVMGWVALDRAIQSVERFGLDGPVTRWRRLRAEIHAAVCREAFNSRRGAFTQYFGSKQLDASLLLMPLVGFLPATDPRMRRTIELIQSELMAGGLVYRYNPEHSRATDSLPPGEGTFLPCSFWLVDCLCLLDRRDEARRLFEHLLRLRNPLGLLAEEYDPSTRRLLGNFPQAISHVALINSAQNLSEQVMPARERSAGLQSSVSRPARRR
ncbi:MAG TPA: glycoside hydrolase family 15 protein [Candidatus Didemnitutus sp.]